MGEPEEQIDEAQTESADAADAAEAVVSADAPVADQAAEPVAAAEADDAVEATAEPPVDESPAPEPPADAEAEDDDAEEAEEPLVTPGMDWFVLRVASNKEDSVKETLLRKIKIEGLTEIVNRILVPTEKKKTMKGGKTRIQTTKLYPGYVFVEMKLEEDGRIPQDVFFLIKETTGVGDFIGTAGRPAAMRMHEVEKMILASKAPEEQPEVKMEFEPGDPVKIKEGPFENMEGTVDVLLPEQGKVRVVVTIFGRATPIEMEYWLIEKADE